MWRLELSSGYLDETTVGVADALFASPYFWLAAVVAPVALTASTRWACVLAAACVLAVCLLTRCFLLAAVVAPVALTAAPGGHVY